MLGSSKTSAAASDAAYIEDVFSTRLYTGNGPSTQTINNGIDLAGKGGLVWVKRRSSAASHALNHGIASGGDGLFLMSNSTGGWSGAENFLFTSSGFSVGNDATTNGDGNFVSWTFRKQPRFFDIVTYTGNGVAGRQISHSLGAVPGCIIVKRTDAATNWAVYHRSLGSTNFMLLNLTQASAAGTIYWNNTDPTSTTFTVGTGDPVNTNGGTYVAYLFAHDAGGFGATGLDNVISCGTCSGAATVNLGYEPQFVLAKCANRNEGWWLFDNMRGLTATLPTFSERGAYLVPNSTAAEASFDNGLCSIAATGFELIIGSELDTYIYIAIRRGPMRTPTSGTSVFQPLATTITSGVRTSTVLPYVDGVISKQRNDGTAWNIEQARLTGTGYLRTESTAAEAQAVGTIAWDAQNAVGILPYSSGQPYAAWLFRRAPGFFDVVCYTGTGANPQTVSHNLTVAPELIIAKKRSAAGDWGVYAAGQADGAVLNATDGFTISNRFTAVNATSFGARLGGTPSLSDSGATYIAYLFASCPGVSKVGSFTGTGNTQTINCGFSSGARFVLIKRTDSAGDWYVWDSARGIVAGNDPYLLLNSTAAEVTNTDWVDTAASGFELSNAAGNLVNTNGGSFIYLAIA